MANITGHDSGFVVKSMKQMTPKPVRKPPSATAVTCTCCGFEYIGSYRQVKSRFITDVDDDGEKERTCIACSNFFGLADGLSIGFSNGYTDRTPQDTKRKLKEADEHGYAIMLKTQNFSGDKTGVSFTVDFGDIFKIKRIGTAHIPNGTREDIFKRFTIDIEVGVETLTLYPHEFAAIPWVEIMLSRKEGAYTEAYLCSEDSQGYFKPTDQCRDELRNMFGDL